MKYIYSLFIFTLSLSALGAPELEIWGRTYDYSCGYFSRRANDLAITYRDTGLAYGTEVSVIVGYAGERLLGGGKQEILSWQDRAVVPARAINDSTWEAKILDKTLHHRTEGRFLEKAQIVVEIREPGKAVRFENGGTTWGYYETDTLVAYVGCVDKGKIPAWGRLGYGTVKKD